MTSFLRCIPSDVGLLVTQAEARSWMGGTSFINKCNAVDAILVLSLTHLTHVFCIDFVISENVGLLVTQAEARSWRGGTSFNKICKTHVINIFFLLNMQCFWLHRQKHEAVGEGQVLIINVKNVYAIHLVFKINLTHIYSIPFIIAENVGLL